MLITIVAALVLVTMVALFQDGGVIRLEYEHDRLGVNRSTLAAPGDTQVLEQLAASLNREFALPRSITLHVEHCDPYRPAAYWDRETSRIAICYRVLTALSNDTNLRSVLRFVTLHEFGHALIDLLDLAVTGREEDAADQFATWWLIRHGASNEALIAASVIFGRGALPDEAALAGSHSLDQQRLFNVTCWVYGASGADAVSTQAGGVASRTPGCAAEFTLLRNAWDRLTRSNTLLGAWAFTVRAARQQLADQTNGKP